MQSQVYLGKQCVFSNSENVAGEKFNIGETSEIMQLNHLLFVSNCSPEKSSFYHVIQLDKSIDGCMIPAIQTHAHL